MGKQSKSKNALAGAIATGIVKAANKMNSPVSEVPSKASGKVDPWEVRNAMETLQRANEIKGNKPLMKAVKAEAEKLVKTVKNC